MNIKNSIAKWIMGDYSFISKQNGNFQLNDFSEAIEEFSNVIYMNIIELLTDIANDVTFVNKSGDAMLFAEFNTFFNDDGQEALNRLFIDGFAVVAFQNKTFNLLDSTEYTINARGQILAQSKNYKNAEIYLLKSDSFRMYGKSDKVFLAGFLKYLNNVLNASNTTTARLGSLIMATPAQAANSPIMASLTANEKQEAETEISENYGGLKNQKQILIWRNAMNFTTVNLAGLDSRTIDKAKFAIQAICDRIKIPANQVAIIETSASNGLSNGGEMREGDLLKYKTFERLLNKTFVKMARDLDLNVDYSIYNKPVVPTPAHPTV